MRKIVSAFCRAEMGGKPEAQVAFSPFCGGHRHPAAPPFLAETAKVYPWRRQFLASAKQAAGSRMIAFFIGIRPAFSAAVSCG